MVRSKPTVSFIIPVYRPYAEAGRVTADSIRSFCPKSRIIVVSKEPPPDPKVTWLAEPKQNKGAVQPINIAVNFCQDDMIVLMNDDMYLHTDPTEAIHDVWNKDDPVRRIGSLMPDTWVNDHPKYATMKGLSFMFIPFPIIAKGTIRDYLNGALYNRRFKHHYSDMYLGYFLKRKYDFNPEFYKSALVKNIEPFFRTSDNIFDNQDIDTYNTLAQFGSDVYDI